MTEYLCSKEQFLKNVSGHMIEIVAENGVNRHIRFRRPDTGLFWFELVTWQGMLCINGDQGTYAFCKQNDMFDFFRNGPETLSINPEYWAEKAKSMDTARKIYNFCEESFVHFVKKRFDGWADIASPEEDKKNALWDEIENTVLIAVDDGKEASFRALDNFKSSEVVDFDFGYYGNFYFLKFDFYYIWCCYAIAWGISQYDALKNNTKPPEIYEALADAAKVFGKYEAHHLANGSPEKAEKNRQHRLKLEALIDKSRIV